MTDSMQIGMQHYFCFGFSIKKKENFKQIWMQMENLQQKIIKRAAAFTFALID